jgi:small-conductance mechanosensitive channel
MMLALRAQNSSMKNFARKLSWLSALAASSFVTLALHAALFDEADLSTPRRAAGSFMQATSRDDWEAARAMLDAPQSTPAQREHATALARQLAYLLSHTLSFDLERISDEPAGKPEDGADLEQIAAIRLEGRKTGVVLRRQALPPRRWVVAAPTLAQVPALYQEHGPSRLESSMPLVLRRAFFGAMQRWQWLGLAAAIAFAVGLGRVLEYLSGRVLVPLTKKTRALWDDEMVGALRSPVRLFLSVLVFAPLAHALGLPAGVRLVCIRIASTLFVAAIAWMAIRVVGVVSNLIERRASQDSRQGPHLRGVQTQVRVLRRVLSSVLAVCAGAVVLMQFDGVRSAGVSLLASAGVAGLVLGLAAQRTLGSLFAGIQLSITQPIRIGDDVVIEGEFGTIEEITLTYVVVKIWDERRLVVPMNRFLEFPFQNWTKVSSELHGTVMLQVAFNVSVAGVRRKLDELLAHHPLWDRRTKAVHVTEARDKIQELRILVSAANSADLFNLRADLREKLVAWLALPGADGQAPRARVESGKTLASP